MLGELLAGLALWSHGDDIDGAADEPLALRQHRLDAGVRGVFGAEDVGNLQRLVVGIDLLHVDDGEERAVVMLERGLAADTQRLFDGVVDGECDRDRPDRAVGQAGAAAYGVKVGLAHVAGEGAEGADGDHFEVAELLEAEGDGR